VFQARISPHRRGRKPGIGVKLRRRRIAVGRDKAGPPRGRCRAFCGCKFVRGWGLMERRGLLRRMVAGKKKRKKKLATGVLPQGPSATPAQRRQPMWRPFMYSKGPYAYGRIRIDGRCFCISSREVWGPKMRDPATKNVGQILKGDSRARLTSIV